MLGRYAGFHAESFLYRVDRTSCISDLGWSGRLTRIRGTKIEALTRCEYLDGIKVLPVECFDTSDVTSARRDVLLQQRRMVESEVDAPLVNGAFQRLRRVVASDPGAGAADVRLEDQRVSDLFTGLQRGRGIIDNDRPWKGEAQ